MQEVQEVTEHKEQVLERLFKAPLKPNDFTPSSAKTFTMHCRKCGRVRQGSIQFIGKGLIFRCLPRYHLTEYSKTSKGKWREANES
jgi:hypothetical protein